MKSETNQKSVDLEKLEALAAAARRKVTRKIVKGQKLIANLKGDLQKHGNAETWKRYGDLILANLNNAERDGDQVIVTDYFDELTPKIRIAGDAPRSLNEIAESYFRRYTKARNAAGIIEKRIAKTEKEIEVENEKLIDITNAYDDENLEFFEEFLAPPRQAVEVVRKKKKDITFNGARRFVSSDGFEILVGKKSTDNDMLTFRVAKSLDLWLHAADYPGSHVVVRNPNRKEIPTRTLLEAAQLAAFYSSGKEQPKAAVNFTQKKFVNKPKRSAPGLVSLAKFKTVLIEPKIGDVVKLET